MRKEIRIKSEGADVLLFVGNTVERMPAHVAKQIADAMRSAAALADEYANKDQIIRDTAILTRAGVTLGLTNRPDFKREAGKLAAWARDLRRYMPGGVKSAEVVGVPAIINTRV